MRTILLAVTALTLLLTGCAHKQTPYKVIKSVDYNHKTRGLQAYNHGVTQEKISATEYLITAKLSSSSDKIRAQNMATYHAAVLAQESGYDSFDVVKRKAGQWCRFRKNKAGMKDFADGGFKASLRVVFTASDAPKNRQAKGRRMNAEQAMSNLEIKINTLPSDEEIKAMENLRWDTCWNS